MSRLAIRRAEPCEGEMVAPPSKYHTHRALILASLPEGESLITGTSESLDNMSTLRCLSLLGTRFERVADGYMVRGGPYRAPDDVLDVGNSGSTICFLLSLASTAPGCVVFTGDASIRSRPHQPYLEALNRWGIEAWSTRGDGRPPIVVRHGDPAALGPYVEVDGLISQWKSGLMLLAPMTGRDVDLAATGEVQEASYVSMTIDMMKRFGIEVTESPDRRSHHIAGGQHYKPAKVRIPGDIASASFGMALAAITGSRLRYSNIDLTVVHPEDKIIATLQRMGADLRIDPDARTVEVVGGRRLRGIEVDCGDAPDMVPILSVLLALSEGKGRITNATQVRLKECDRLAAMFQLNKMGALVRETADGLEFEGVETLHGAEIESFHDHRIQMSFAVAGAAAEGTTWISDAESAAVSYPGFLSDMKRLGIPIEIVDNRTEEQGGER